MTVFNTTMLVRQLKADGQDFEYYPTTEQMLSHVIDDLDKNVHIERSFDLLDIGAGDCRLHQLLSKKHDENRSNFQNKCPRDKFPFSYYYHDCLVIEKAIVHIQNLSKLPNASALRLVGTDFWETDLSCIIADVCFTNPPYSVYEWWLTQVINNARTPLIYAIVPSRWADNANIKKALKLRDMTAEIIHSDDFLTADRQARAKVDILRITHKSIDTRKKSPEFYQAMQERYQKDFVLSYNAEKSKSKLDPLTAFFEQHLQLDCSDDTFYQKAEQDKQDLASVFKQDKLSGLLDRYLQDRQTLQADLTALSQITPRLFALFKIDGSTIINKLRHDLKVLKRQYWNVFFDCYEPITRRLTSKSRDSLKDILKEHTELDFTYGNCQAVSILAIQRANDFIDEQIKDLFEKHADKDNLVCYKSNQRVLSNYDYRYRDKRYELYSHTKLEYRLIVNYWFDSNRPYEFFNEGSYLSRTAYGIINDYVVIARTLGFDIPNHLVSTKDGSYPDFGKTLLVHNEKDKTLLFDIKFYKKGTYHIRLNSDFCLRLNVAIGKLFGWLHTPDDISEIDEKADKNVWYALSHLNSKVLAIDFNLDDTAGEQDTTTNTPAS